jgi:hypothetical protein
MWQKIEGSCKSTCKISFIYFNLHVFHSRQDKSYEFSGSKAFLELDLFLISQFKFQFVINIPNFFNTDTFFMCTSAICILWALYDKVFEQLTAPPILEMCFLENVSYIMQNAYQIINFLAKFQAQLSKMVRDTKGINYSLLIQYWQESQPFPQFYFNWVWHHLQHVRQETLNPALDYPCSTPSFSVSITVFHHSYLPVSTNIVTTSVIQQTKEGTEQISWLPLAN